MSYQPLQSEDATLRPVAGTIPCPDVTCDRVAVNGTVRCPRGRKCGIGNLPAGSAPTGDAALESGLDAYWKVMGGIEPDVTDAVVAAIKAANPHARSQGCAGLPATDEQRCQDYLAGWNNSAIWAGREDLLSDVDSAAYIKERDALLASRLPQDKKGGI